MRTINKYLTMILFWLQHLDLQLNRIVNLSEESAADDLPLPSVLFKKHIDAVGGEAIYPVSHLTNHSWKIAYQGHGY